MSNLSIDSIPQNTSCSSLIQHIDRGLHSIYNQKGLEYLNEYGIGKFAEYCNVNEYGDENIVDDLDPDAKDECMLIDFDPTFPFNGNQCDRNLCIFNMLYDLYQRHLHQHDGHPVDPRVPEPNEDRKSDDDDEESSENITPFTSDRINLLCQRMRHYFHDHKVEYPDIISNFCSDRGIDDDDDLYSVRDELLGVLLPVFPFTMHIRNTTNSNRRKAQFIWSLMESFAADYIDPGRLPQEVHTVVFLQSLFDSVTKNDFIRSRERYKAQCPAMWRRDMQIDHLFVFALAIGDKFQFPFLQYLVDDYLCTKANRQRFPNGLSVQKWASHCNRYMMALKQYNVPVRVKWMESFTDNDGGHGVQRIRSEEQRIDGKAYDILVHAVGGWSKRCVQDWKTTQNRIDDSEEEFMEMFGAHIRWMHNAAKFTWEQTVCSMQIDICYVFDKQRVNQKRVKNKGLYSL